MLHVIYYITLCDSNFPGMGGAMGGMNQMQMTRTRPREFAMHGLFAESSPVKTSTIDSNKQQ